MKLPDLPELIALRSAAHGLSLDARHPSRARLLGGYRSLQRGRGLEFEDVRAYVAGDDARSIDWRVTARRGKPHTKLFREERERPVWLLVDLHPEMFFGSRRQLKSVLTVRAAALLAWTATLNGDRVGAVVTGSGMVRALPPRLREAGALPLLNALLDLQPRAPGEPQPQSLADALRRLTLLLRPGSLFCVLSDFAHADAECTALLSRLAAHNQGRIFWITDSLESQALPTGRFRAGLPARISTFDGNATRSRWLQEWRERELRLTALARDLSIPLSRLETGDAAESSLQTLLEARTAAA